MTDAMIRLLLVDVAVFAPVLFSSWPKHRFGPAVVPIAGLVPLATALTLKYVVRNDAAALAAAGQAEAAAARSTEGTVLLVVGILSGVGVLATVAYRGRKPSPPPG